MTLFPHTKQPIICNAPMLGTASAPLATAVSKAGGFGFIAGGFDLSPNSSQLQSLDTELTAARTALGLQNEPDTPLPLGIGFLTLLDDSIAHFEATVVPLLEKHKPAAIWLFAPNDASIVSSSSSGSGGASSTSEDVVHPHQRIITAIHASATKHTSSSSTTNSSSPSKHHTPLVFIQIGTVAAARAAASHGADILVAQGSDAGGHQFAANASIVGLVPEVRDMLDSEFNDANVSSDLAGSGSGSRRIGLFAAGGIVDGRGVAAALALGAEGVVMGTRFVVSRESLAIGEMKGAILEAVDGGRVTMKSTVHDDIQSTPFWPTTYDGRALIGKSFKDHMAGLPLEDNIAKYKAALAEGDMSRRTVWAGTGVGLIKTDQDASAIVETVREEAKKVLRRLQQAV